MERIYNREEIIRGIFYFLKELGITYIDLLDFKKCLYAYSKCEEFYPLFRSFNSDHELKELDISLEFIKIYRGSIPKATIKLPKVTSDDLAFLSEEDIEKLKAMANYYSINYSLKENRNINFYRMNPNQRYQLVYSSNSHESTMKDVIIWQLVTDGDISYNSLKINYPYDESTFRNPRTNDKFLADFWPVRTVELANASYAMLQGINNKIISRVHIYTEDANIAMDEALIGAIETKKNPICDRAPYVYKLELK